MRSHAIDFINGVGAHTAQLLRNNGIYRIEDIAKTPVEVMSAIAGKWGESLWEKAQGKGSTDLQTDWEQKSISHEKTFDKDSNDSNFLIQQLLELVEETAADVRSEEKMSGCITVKIKYHDFEVSSKQETIDYTVLDDVLQAKAKSLFSELYQTGRKVRLIGVRCSHLVSISLQMSLFDQQIEKLQLYQTMDALNNRFGKNTLTKAAHIRNSRDDKSEDANSK